VTTRLRKDDLGVNRLAERPGVGGGTTADRRETVKPGHESQKEDLDALAAGLRDTEIRNPKLRRGVVAAEERKGASWSESGEKGRTRGFRK